jgi:hypothetical protein
MTSKTEGATLRSRRVRAKQDAFLSHYILDGTIKNSAKSIGVDRSTVYKWSRDDISGFRDRFIEAQEDFGDSLEEIAISRVKEQKPGDNPVLLITLLNAHKPEKYRRTGNIDSSQSKEIMETMKKWYKSESKKKKSSSEDGDSLSVVEEAEGILARKFSPGEGTPTD